MMPSRTSKVRFKPRECGVALLEVFDDAQRVQVVVEEVAVFAHGAVERLLAGVAEGRMPDVVHQGKSLGEIDVQARGRPAMVREICATSMRVRQAIAKMIGVAPREDLRLVFQPPEGARVNDAVAVALESHCDRDGEARDSGVRVSVRREPRTERA